MPDRAARYLFQPPLTEAQYEALPAEAKAFLRNLVEGGFSFPDRDAPLEAVDHPGSRRPAED